MMSSPWASSQASASWPGVHFFSLAMASMRATRSRFFSKFSPWNRGEFRRVIVGCKILEAFDLAGKKTAAKRTVGYESDSHFARSSEDFVFRIAAPQRILRLQCCDRMHFVSAADGVRGRFGQSEIVNFSCFHEFRHHADGFFNRHRWIDAVLIIQIDSFNAETLQTGVARFANIFRTTVDAANGGISAVADDPEFCGEKKPWRAIYGWPCQPIFRYRHSHKCPRCRER